MINKITLGIDLGTTNSVASYWNGTTHNLIYNNNLSYFPSIIKFSKQGKHISSKYDTESIRNFKRVIGLKASDTNTMKLIPDLNYNIKIENDIIYFFNEFENKFYTIEELNSLILKNIKVKADKQTKQKINDVVITIPAHFNQIQRESVLISSKLAGLNCIRLINEPTAAALSYGMNYHNDVNVLIFDLGGGTLDLSILNIDEGVFEVINTYGDNCLGGEDFTKILVKDCLSKFKEANKYYNLDNSIINKSLSILRNKCENLKCNILDENEINISKFYIDEKLEFDLKYTITKKEINILFEPLIEKIKFYLEKIMTLSNLNNDDIDYIILVGGSTRLNHIKFNLESFFQKNVICNIDPDQVVSIGASIMGYTINNPETVFSSNIALVDILPLSIGIESDNGTMTKIINKGAKIPITKNKYFTTEDEEQEEVLIKIFQGERNFVKDNIEIGYFSLKKLKNIKKKNMIKIEIKVDNNGVINISAFEKNSDNKSSITIKNNNNLYDKDKINKLIEEAEKYEDIDNIKFKLCKKYKFLKSQIDNLKYNCFHNENIKLSEVDNKDLECYISNLDNKLKEVIIPVGFLIYTNVEYKNINIDQYQIVINQINKLIKLNDKRYPALIISYNNKENSNNISAYEKNDNSNNYKSNITEDYNAEFKKEISEIIKNLDENNKISDFSKNILVSYINNLNYKLESIRLDNHLYNEYFDNFKSTITNILLNNKDMVQKYGKIEIVRKIITKYNINIQITKQYNELELFNLIYDITNQNNISLDGLDL